MIAQILITGGDDTSGPPVVVLIAALVASPLVVGLTLRVRDRHRDLRFGQRFRITLIVLGGLSFVLFGAALLLGGPAWVALPAFAGLTTTTFAAPRYIDD